MPDRNTHFIAEIGANAKGLNFQQVSPFDELMFHE